MPSRHAHRSLLLACILACPACSGDGGGGSEDNGAGDAARDSGAELDEGASGGSGDTGAETDGGVSDGGADGGADVDAGDAGSADTPDATPDVDEPVPVPEECFDDLAPGEKVVFYDGFEDGSEGIAFGPGGFLYVTNQGDDRAVWRLDRDGNATRFAGVPFAIGIAATADDGLIVASIGASITAGVADGAIYRVDALGAVSELATGIDSPNFVTMMPDGSALISDDFDTRVFRVAMDGGLTTAIADVRSPNGMAWSPDRSRLYVASTFTTQGEVTEFPWTEAGAFDAVNRRVIGSSGPGAFNDGIAVDARGRVYVAVNLRGEIVRIDPAEESPAPVRIASGLTNPASIAFGAADGFDPCSLYVTQLYAPEIWRVAVGAIGDPLP